MNEKCKETLAEVSEIFFLKKKKIVVKFLLGEKKWEVVLGHNLQAGRSEGLERGEGASVWGPEKVSGGSNKSQELGWLTARWVAVPRKCERHMLAAERMGVVFTHLRLSLKTRFKTSVLG